MANRIKLTAKRKTLLLAALEYNANVTRACKVAGITTSCAYQHKQNNPDFAADWDAAIKAAVDRLEGVAWLRATEGVEKPVYQQGQCVGYVQQYSDSLLIFLLKGHNPDRFKDRAAVELMAKVDISDAKGELSELFETGAVDGE